MVRRRLRKINIFKPIKKFLRKISGGKKAYKKGPKRKIRKSIIIVPLLIIALFIGIFKVPQIVNNGKLKKLGYSKEEITAIKELKLTNIIIKNEWYSDYLAVSIRDKSIKKEYIELYLVSNELQEKDFLIYHRLLDKGYNKETVLNIFSSLKFFEITPLLVFDFQENINPYIDDVKSHRDVNNENHFELTNSYYTPYANPKMVEDVNNPNMLVNKTYYVDENYIPYQIAPLSVRYASNGLELASEAAIALGQWCDKAMSLKNEITGESSIRFYAASAYRPYARQDELYNSYVKTMGEEKANAVSAKAGFSEHQTGYAVDLASLGNEGLTAFVDTDAYVWASANASDFGFILRYPDGKKAITGYEFESWHYRYIGRDLAKLVEQSKLTYDEFYMLYLASWNDESLKYEYMPEPAE